MQIRSNTTTLKRLFDKGSDFRVGKPFRNTIEILTGRESAEPVKMIIDCLLSLKDDRLIDVGDVYRPKNKRYAGYRTLTIYEACDGEFFGFASLSFYIDETDYQRVVENAD